MGTMTYPNTREDLDLFLPSFLVDFFKGINVYISPIDHLGSDFVTVFVAFQIHDS